VEPRQAADLYLKRRQAKGHLVEYIRYMRPAILPDFQHEPAAHHEVIAGVLTEMAGLIGDAGADHAQTAISLPPGSAKSFYGSITWPTYLLAKNPSWKILCVSAGESLAEDFARRRRQIMLSPYWESLAGTSLMPDSRSLEFMGTKEGGGIYAYGAGSTIQGIRADALVADDLVKGHEMAASLSQLDKLWNWYVSEARERLKPEGIELMIATRWALLDPIGRVLRLTEKKLENWTYLRIPHVADSEDDLLGRKPGERLWPEYFTVRRMKMAQRNPLFWQTLHQQNPAVSEFAWCPLDHIHIKKRKDCPERLSIYIGCDIALKLGQGDYTVFAIVGIDQEKHFYLLDLYREQCDPNEAAKVFLRLCEEWEPRYSWIENDNQSVMWGGIVDLLAKERQVPNKLLLSKMKNREKEERAAKLRNLFLQDRVVFAEGAWNEMAIREVGEFPGGRNDDIIDAMAVVAKELHRLSGPAALRDDTAPKPVVGNFQMKEGKIMTTQPFEKLWLNAGSRRGRI
jgi:predicted phage terminase large subunit-like protein